MQHKNIPLFQNLTAEMDVTRYSTEANWQSVGRVWNFTIVLTYIIDPS